MNPIADQIGLDLLRTYVAVCHHRSINRVAAQRGRTQSALSMQVRRLEGLLGRRLFDRTGRGVTPTAEGELLLGYASRILALADEAVDRLRAVELRGSLRIGLAEELAAAALPALLGRLRHTHPGVRLDVVVQHSVAVGHLWRDGRLDLMVGPTSVTAEDASVVWDADLRWVCAPDHVPDDARPLDVVAFAAPCVWRQRMLDALVAAGREHRVTFASQSIPALQTAVERGLGVGLLPPGAVREGGTRVVAPCAGVSPSLTVQYGLYAPDRRTPLIDAAMGALLDELDETCMGLGRGPITATRPEVSRGNSDATPSGVASHAGTTSGAGSC